MKIQFFLKMVYVLGLFTLNLKAQLPAYVPTTGLIAWYSYNGNANDASPNLNHGIVNGAMITQDRFSNANSAYSFNNSTISHTSQLIPSNNSFAISFWVKPNSTGVQEFMSQNFWPSAFYVGFNGVQIRCGDTWQATGVNLTLNTWEHYVIVRDFGVNVKIYRNGNLVATKATDISMGGSLTDPLIIGKQYGSNAEYYSGIFDDFGIWNRTLTAQEVQMLYNSCTSVQANIVSQGSQTFCAGGSCTLLANTGVGYSYEWYNNGLLINGATSSSLIATISGNYHVKVINGGQNCYATSSIYTINVNAIPSINFNIQNPLNPPFIYVKSAQISLTATPVGGIFTGPGIQGSVFTPTLAGLGNKSLKYSYSDNNGCSNSVTRSVILFDTVQCPTPTGLIKNSSEVYNEKKILVYPNPNEGFVTVELKQCENTTISVCDISGRIVYHKKAQLLNVVDLKNNDAGIYIINVLVDNNVIYMTKVIKD